MSNNCTPLPALGRGLNRPSRSTRLRLVFIGFISRDQLGPGPSAIDLHLREQIAPGYSLKGYFVLRRRRRGRRCRASLLCATCGRSGRRIAKIAGIIIILVLSATGTAPSASAASASAASATTAFAT